MNDAYLFTLFLALTIFATLLPVLEILFRGKK